MDLKDSAAPLAPPAGRTGAAAYGMLERLPKWLICVPLVAQWLWLSLRHGSAMLPTAANDGITAGGLIGEGKLEYFAGGPLLRAAVAPYTALRARPEITQAQLAGALEAAQLQLPIIAKPDIGFCGYGVRRIDDLAALQRYVSRFPAGETVVLQAYIADRGEAGVFYARDPETDVGRVVGLAFRAYPRVTGDGSRTIGQLIAADVRLRRLLAPGHEAPAARERVPAPGEEVRLATIGSTRVGGLYTDGARAITPALEAAIDAIARDMPGFYFGRFDVRFDDLERLRRGEGFRIIEINGAGSEAIQAWDPAIGLFQGLGMVFEKQRLLFDIAAKRRRRGAAPMGVRALAKLFRRQQALVPLYPPSN